MAHFKIYSSNRLEILFEYLVENLTAPLPCPLSPLYQEMIVVQSQGMERWLSMMLAQRFGIWANACYPFPDEAIRGLIRSVLPDFSNYESFDPLYLSWKIMKYLTLYRDKEGFESIRNYLGNEEDNVKRMQLAEQCAKIFDQYTMYRPDMVLRWEEGEGSHWQAQLWREIIKEGPRNHKAAIRKEFLDEIAVTHKNPENNPSRIFIFGIPFLPPLHIDVFSAMARYLDIYLFLMNPCKEYWFDIVSEKTTAKIQKKSKGKIVPAEELYYETGHPLLASLGKQGAHFFEHALDISNVEEVKRFEDPGQATLLSCLQSDILNLRKRRSDVDFKKVIAEDDDSLHIHVCHSPMREIEVLYDHILDLFQRKPDLLPGEILVMTPDIEKYAPYISAVFESDQSGGEKIPFSIADRSARKQGQILEVFIKILYLYESRFGAAHIMDIIETPAVKERFDLDEEAIEYVRRWVEMTRIRWGIDGEDRSHKGIPYFEENSWMMGLERLLLGYALPGKGERMFGEILPYDDIEGKDAQILGQFVECVKTLFEQIKTLETPRTLADWASVLHGLVERFFKPDRQIEAELSLIDEALANLSKIQESSGFEETVELEVIRAYLTDYLNRTQLIKGFLTGGVTFCTMHPMRSIPFRIIMLVGMNDGAFPRLEKAKGFDLMAHRPQKGDPSKRDLDRYIFLETLLSARELLYISYVGLSIRDNSQIPPSVVVSELIDTIKRDFMHPHKEIITYITTHHYLQAFNPAYFQSEGPLFSYSKDNFQALKTRMERKGEKRSFISEPLPDPPVEFKTINLEQLARFFKNPAKYFVHHRLGMRIEEFSDPLNEREPFEVEGLARYKITQELVAKKLSGHEVRDFYPLLRAQGVLPPGAMGLLAYNELCGESMEFAAKVWPFIQQEEKPALSIDVEIPGFRIVGRIGNVWPQGLVRYRCAQIKAKDILNTWIEHCVLNYCGEAEYPQESVLIGSDKILHFDKFDKVDICKELLEELVDLYWQGMHIVLPFFPETSRIYAETLLVSGGDMEKALIKAQNTWKNDFNKSEADDPYFHLCFGTMDDPLKEDFMELALRIFEPVLTHMEMSTENEPV
ncbi:MAG: exodeoxyribonuclease V subunit gamma [bacterium]